MSEKEKDLKADSEDNRNAVETASADENGENTSERKEENSIATNHETREVNGEDKPAKKNRLPLFIGGAVVLIAAIGGLIYWIYARQYESTDDAFIEGNIVQVSPKVSAYVAKVLVKENQPVHKGDLLVELDTKDLEARLEAAKAQLRAARAQRGQAQAGVDLTRKTTNAGQSEARSNVETARSNVEQTRLAADAKQSQIRQAQTAVKTAQANLAQTRTQIPQAEANLTLAQKEYDRRLALFNRGDVSRQSLEQATTALQTAQAQLDAARRQVDAAASRVGEAQAGVQTAQQNYRQSIAQINLTQSQVNEATGRLADAAAAPERIAVNQSQVGTAEATIAQAETAVSQAELELSYTKIIAPEDGFVTRKTVQEGQLVQPGSALMALTQPDVWVVANFKETQLEDLRVGQDVEVKVDAYPSRTFHGKIDSFQAGTGSRFSVLPSENATGNYVKVVQRVPVKIIFTETPENVQLLAPGMSAEPSVKVR